MIFVFCFGWSVTWKPWKIELGNHNLKGSSIFTEIGSGVVRVAAIINSSRPTRQFFTQLQVWPESSLLMLFPQVGSTLLCPSLCGNDTKRWSSKRSKMVNQVGDLWKEGELLHCYQGQVLHVLPLTWGWMSWRISVRPAQWPAEQFSSSPWVLWRQWC